jgi:hypothetical protein
MKSAVRRPAAVAHGRARAAAQALLGSKRARAIAAAAAVGALAAPATASAAINSPPQNGHSIIAFPSRDFVSATGYAHNDLATVEVFRAGVLIGRAADVVPRDDPKTKGVFDGIVEVNHPGGACWGTGVGSPNVTPDILAGDVVRITTAPGVGDQTTTANVTAERALDAGAGIVVVHGTAQDEAGNPLAVDQIEQRIVAAGDAFDLNGRRTLRATNGPGSDGTLEYDAPGSINWTATYRLTSDADVARATANQSRGMWLGTNPASTAEATVFEDGEVGGPSAPCAAPAARNAVTTSSPAVVNASFAVTASALTLSGVAQADATAVSVTINDQDPTTVPVTVDAALTIGAGGAMWTASIPAPSVIGFHDGILTASAAYSVPTAPIGGAPLDIVKDTVAPTAPTAAPAGGLFRTDQSVRLSAEAGATIHATTDGSPATADSPAISGPIAVTENQTISAIAIDRAGNAGPPATAAFTIDKVAPRTTDNVPANSTKAPVAATLFSDDGTGSGVTETWYTTDGSDPAVASNPSRRRYHPATPPTLNNGERITYYSIDRAGNTEAPHASRAARVDTIAPKTTEAPAAPAAPAPAAAPAAPKPVPVVANTDAPPVRMASVLKAARARARGLALTVTVPAGASIIKVRVTRRHKHLATVYAFPKRAGLLRMRLAGLALRHQLAPGLYELRIQAGTSPTTLGAPTVKKFRVKR